MIRKIMIIFFVLVFLATAYAYQRSYMWRKLPLDLGPAWGCLICECNAAAPARVKVDVVLLRQRVELWCWVGNLNPKQRYTFPLTWILLASAVYPLWSLARLMVIRLRRRRDGACTKCGYLLVGNESGVCPECGQTVEIAADPPASPLDVDEDASS